MKYLNGKDIFPPELLELIQVYAQGQYIYVPKKDESKEKWGTKTSYKIELENRNSQIYTKFLTGFTIEQLIDGYHLSEKSLKRILLNKRREADNMKEQITEQLKLWGIDVKLKQIYDTVWSVGDDYVIKIYTSLANMKRNIEIMKTLYESGIPVAKPIPTKAGQDYAESNGTYYLLMNKLTGAHVMDIYKEDYVSVAHKAGSIVAKLHTAFLACEQKLTLWNNSLVDEMNGWIQVVLKDNQYRYCSEEDFNESLKELKSCYDKLPRQMIHRDIHFGNLLFDQGEFSGYVDFDFSQKNVRIFDICYFLIGLLIDHDKKVEDVCIWYEIIASFIKGYETVNKLTELEKDSICCLMKSIELLFVSYFINEKNEMQAEIAAGLYYFVKRNEADIHLAVHK